MAGAATPTQATSKAATTRTREKNEQFSATFAVVTVAVSVTMP